MHTVFLHCTRCRETVSCDLHREKRAVAIAVVAQLEETEKSASTGRGIGILQGDIRTNRMGKLVRASTDLVWEKLSMKKVIGGSPSYDARRFVTNTYEVRAIASWRRRRVLGGTPQHLTGLAQFLQQ